MAMTKLFASRWHQANHITVTYLKRLFNDHFLVFLVIAFGAGVLGYRELLTDPRYMQLWQSPWLIAAVVLWLIVGLQFGALITYFKPADAGACQAGVWRCSGVSFWPTKGSCF